jgi:hypothetical protein
MAMYGAQFALTATATSLFTAIGGVVGDSSKRYAKAINVKNAAAAINICYLGPSTVTNVPANAFAEISAGTTFNSSPSGSNTHNIDLTQVFIVGTVGAANVAFIAVTI